MGYITKQRWIVSIESATEQGIKTAFRAYTDTLDPDSAVTYRCFFLDDETDSGEPTEKREYPLIQIHASPNWPTQHKSTFRHIPVEIKWATHRSKDPKKTTVASLYQNCRTLIDAVTTILVSGYNVMGIIIEQGGESGVDDNENYITLPLTVKICGA